MPHDTWITGVGAITPLGNDFPTFADRLLNGESGIRHIELLQQWGESPSTVGCVDQVARPDGFDGAVFDGLQRLDQFVVSCALRAVQDAGLKQRLQQLRVGVVLGLGAERLRVWELDQTDGSGCVDDPQQEPEPILSRFKQWLAIDGPAMVVAAACASGNYALGIGRDWVASGLVDVCLAGSFDVVTPLAFVGFNNLRALSRSARPPAAASRPFDTDRDGFVMAEGGAMFVLEPAQTARQRKADCYAELLGFGASSDASHMIIPSQDPGPASRAIRAALQVARVDPSQVDYLNAHATSTPVGDRAECNVLKQVFGSLLPQLPVSSTKGATGHALSGAASVEALACLVALARQTLPPTLNLDNPDPECPLLHVAGQARDHRTRIVMSNSFGFGGSNTSIVLRRAA